MRPLGLSANALAKAIDVAVTRVSEIVRGRRGVTADTALRLGRFFGTSPELWLGLQAEYDLRTARRDSGAEIANRISPLKMPGSPGEIDSPRIAERWEVRESTSGYGRQPQRGTRDRRRLRRRS